MKHRYTLLVSLGAWMVIMGFSMVKTEDYWGFFGHRRINRLAVFTLVPEMMPVFKKNIDYLTEHAVDPDKRRYAIPGEAIRHYIDLDVWHQMGRKSLAKSYAEARATFGDWVYRDSGGQTQSVFPDQRVAISGNKKYILFTQTDTTWVDFFAYQRFLNRFFNQQLDPEEDVWLSADSLNSFFNQSILPSGLSFLWVDTFSQHGILPFYIPQAYLKLVYAFKLKDLNSILRLAADLGHYIGDAHVPLHTTSNYNGQMTGQTGLHAFWESRIPELFADDSYDYLVGQARYIKDVESFIWDIVNHSHDYVDSVLLVEKRLSEQFPKDQQYCFTERNQLIVKLQCEAYAKAYQIAMNGMVEQRMRAAIHAVGSIWYSAWIDAGQPNLSTLSTGSKPESDSLPDHKSSTEKVSLRPEN